MRLLGYFNKRIFINGDSNPKFKVLDYLESSYVLLKSIENQLIKKIIMFFNFLIFNKKLVV